MSTHRHPLLAVLLLGAALSSGCSAPTKTSEMLPTALQTPGTWRPMPEISTLTYEAADDMAAQLRASKRARGSILPASFVDDNNLDRSSAMGRLLAQQMASRLSQTGHSVLEIKLRKNIRLRRGEGQFLLSRELENIAARQKATAVLVGSYVESRSKLFVNSQLIALENGVVLASRDYTLPLTFELRALLRQDP